MSSQQTDLKPLPKGVHLSFDKLKLRASLKIDPDVTIDTKLDPLAEIVKALEKIGIKDIDKKAVADLLDNIERDESAVIAEGVPPKGSKDGQVQYHFETNRERTVGDQGRLGKVDHRELNLIQNVKQGDTLAKTTPPEPGVPGRNILGDEIPAPPGKAAKIRIGRGVRIEQDGLKAVAAQDGMVTFEGGKIEVLPIYRVLGDVDYETGNIRFVGDVIVGGHVREDFGVKATGDVTVFGNVDKGDIEADGSVEVTGGILGKKTVSVGAGADITASFADNANLVAGGCALVRGEMLWSSIQADKVVLEGPKGFAIGGTLRACREIRVTNASNPDSEPKTLLEITADSTATVQLEGLKAELKQVRKGIEEANKAHSHWSKVKERPGSLLSERVENTLQELPGKIRAGKEKEGELSREIEQLQQKLSEPKRGKIVVTGKAFPGTRIIIHGAAMDITDTVASATFTNENGEIVVKT